MPKSPGVVRRPANAALPKKVFTLEEARRMLPLVKRIVADIQESHTKRVDINTQLSNTTREVSPQEGQRLRTSFGDTGRRLESLFRELAQLGVDLKDPARGLLDFPAMHEGRIVSLCWLAGEETVDHWHETTTGFAGRRPVAELGDQ